MHQRGRSSRCVGDKFHEQLLPKAIEVHGKLGKLKSNGGEKYRSSMELSINFGTLDMLGYKFIYFG